MFGQTQFLKEFFLILLKLDLREFSYIEEIASANPTTCMDILKIYMK